jgi:hypothetical protein
MALNSSKVRLATNTIFMIISHNVEGGMGYYTGKGSSKAFNTVKDFSGDVISLSRVWDEGSPADKIKPHFKYVFVFQDGDEAYSITLSESTTYTTELLNQFLNANPAKLEVHVRFWSKDDKKVRLTLCQNNVEVPRFYSEWDNELKTCVGIPPAEDGGTNCKARNAFWFEKFKTILYPKFNGGEEWKEAADQKPATETAPTTPQVNIHEGTIADTKTTPATNLSAYEAIKAKFGKTPPESFPQKWETMADFIRQQEANGIITKIQSDNLVVMSNTFYENWRIAQFPEPPQLFFQLDGTTRQSIKTYGDGMDDLPF